MFSLKFSESLKENYKFRRVYSKGKSAAAPCLALYVRPNRSETNRLGITVSKKTGNAVTRNKIRRRLREIYRTNEDKFAIGFDIVAVARFRAVRAEYAVMEREFLELAERLGAIK